MVSIKGSIRKAVLVVAVLLFASALFAARGMLFGVFYGPVMAVSVSSDGRYAISTHRSKELVLWDLESQNHEVLSEDANIYSAYFVPGHDAFLWQDTHDVVRVQTVDGKTLKQFKHFPTYGHVITKDLQTYLASDDQWNLFAGYGENKEPVLADGISPSFVGTGKLLNLSVATEKPLFISAGRGTDDSAIEDYKPIDPDRRFSKYKGVTLWDLDTLKPIAKLGGNSVKTHATISPDGQWVVSGDENGIGLFWNTEPPFKRQRLADYHSGVFLDPSPDKIEDSPDWDRSQLIDAPKGVTDTTIANAFIYKNEYFLRFGNNSHKAGLFKAGNPWPQKYFDLGKSPVLVTYGSQYSRNTAIATSPEAGVLVMGHKSDGGLSVYQFDARTKTLERTWVVD